MDKLRMTKQGNNKKMKILTRKNKMAMNNLVRVSKRLPKNTKNTRLDRFYFWGQQGQWEAPRGSVLRALDALLEDIKGTKKCITDIKSTRVKTIYIYIFF